METATRTLERELEVQGKAVYFAVFRDYFLAADPEVDYKAIAARYELTTVNVSNYLTFAKRRYRAHLRAAVRETVTDSEALHEELGWLFGNEES